MYQAYFKVKAAGSRGSRGDYDMSAACVIIAHKRNFPTPHSVINPDPRGHQDVSGTRLSFEKE